MSFVELLFSSSTGWLKFSATMLSIGSLFPGEQRRCLVEVALRSSAHGSCGGVVVVVVVEGDHQRGWGTARAHILAASEREVTCTTGLLLHYNTMSGIPPMTGRISERPQACRHGVTLPPPLLLPTATTHPPPPILSVFFGILFLDPEPRPPSGKRASTLLESQGALSKAKMAASRRLLLSQCLFIFVFNIGQKHL